MLTSDKSLAIELLCRRAMMERVNPRELIDWAFGVLEHGFESTHTLYLAGSNENEDRRIKFDTFETALTELGFKAPKGEELLNQYVRIIAQKFLQGALSADETMGYLNRVWVHTEYGDLKANEFFLNLLHPYECIDKIRETDPALADQKAIEFKEEMTQELTLFLAEQPPSE